MRGLIAALALTALLSGCHTILGANTPSIQDCIPNSVTKPCY